MEPEVVMDLLGSAFYLTVLVVALIVGPSLVVGLLVSMFQAATQINEQTLSFLPRLIVTLLALMFAGHWIVGMIMDFTIDLVQRIPAIIG